MPRGPAGHSGRIMLSGIWIVVLATCYTAALALELAGLRWRFAGRRAALAGCTLAGIVVHALVLGSSFTTEPVPLASPAEWLSVAAFALVIVYLAAILYLPRSPTGLLLLPLVLALLSASQVASRQPFAPDRTFYVWGLTHGLLLLLGTVTMCIGFLAGITYLYQSYALKHAQSLGTHWRLPSLEWLQHVNGRMLAVSTVLILLGFAAGVVLSILNQRHDASLLLWRDPIVQSSAAMLLWLFAAEAFRLVYPAARQGRKVAYLTLASFAFVVITVLVLTLANSGHALSG
jgi:ABC-type uncharacterized transport system permease subunit